MPVCLSVILFDLHARLILNWLKNEGTPASSHTRDVSPTGYLLSASCRISALATCYLLLATDFRRAGTDLLLGAGADSYTHLTLPTKREV